jgi:hypothetical protein
MKNYLDDLEVKSQTELLSPLLHHVFQPFSLSSFFQILPFNFSIEKKQLSGTLKMTLKMTHLHFSDLFMRCDHCVCWLAYKRLFQTNRVRAIWSFENCLSDINMLEIKTLIKHWKKKNPPKLSFENCYLNLKTGQPILET